MVMVRRQVRQEQGAYLVEKDTENCFVMERQYRCLLC